MATSNDSTLVLRIPQELKERLQQEAERLDVSLSEVIRMKIMIAENALHREPVIRLGDSTYRLWEVLRPDLLEYDLVASEKARSPQQALLLVDEPIGEHNDSVGPISEVVKRAVSLARTIALSLGNAEINRVHLLLALIEAGEGNALRIITYLAGDPAKIRKELEDAVRGNAVKLPVDKPMPLSRPAAKVLKLMHLEAKRLGSKVADSTILLLAILRNPEMLPSTILKPFGIDYESVSQCAASGRRAEDS